MILVRTTYVSAYIHILYICTSGEDAESKGADAESNETQVQTFHSQIRALKQLSNAKSEKWLKDNMLPPIQSAASARKSEKKKTAAWQGSKVSTQS